MPTCVVIPGTLLGGKNHERATAELAQALMPSGVVHESYWSGSLAGTLETSIEAMSYHEAGDRELSSLTWWTWTLALDVAAIEAIYDPDEAAQRLREDMDIAPADTLAAFAIVGSTGGACHIGDSLLRLRGLLQELGCRPDAAARQIVGALSHAVNWLGGWCPATALEEFKTSDWFGYDDDDASAFHPREWEKLPLWLFAFGAKESSLLRLVRKLEGSGVRYSNVFWTCQYALELVRALEACKKVGDHCTKLGYFSYPSIALAWHVHGDMDALDHWYDLEYESVQHSECNDVAWLWAFEPSDPQGVEEAINHARLVLRLVGALDRCLTALLGLKEAPQADRVQVRAEEVRVRV